MELPRIRAGFVGFGEVNTPREMIERLCSQAVRQLEKAGVDVVKTPPVSDDAAGKDVARARRELAGKEFDVLIVCLAGWIPTHAVIATIDSFSHKPMILWGLTGWKERGHLVTTAAQAGTTALRQTMESMGYRFKYVVDFCGEPSDMEAIVGYARAAKAAGQLRGAKIGTMGYRDMNLYATLHDGTSLRSKIGPEVEVFEMLEMAQAIEKLEKSLVDEWVGKMKTRWTFGKKPGTEALTNAAKLYLAVSAKVRARGYEAVSLIDVDGVKKLMGFPPAPVFMLLGEEEKVCTVPENDIMGAVTQLMTRYLTGQIAPYFEFYEFTRAGMLMGVPDYIPSEIVQGKVTVMPNAFGQLGEGLLNISTPKTGRITLARLAYSGNKYMLHLATGTARKVQKWEEAGWAPPAPQLPSIDIALDSPVDDFIGKVMGQHYIISYGDNSALMRNLCGLLGVEVI